jgi:hypothetical protein
LVVHLPVWAWIVGLVDHQMRPTVELIRDGNASDRSNGRSDAGLDRARLASENLHAADSDLRKHPNIANDLHVNANDLRADYQIALAANPNLTFGQFVAATRLANNRRQ